MTLAKKRIIFISVFFGTLLVVFALLGAFRAYASQNDEFNTAYTTDSEAIHNCQGNYYWVSQSLNTDNDWIAATSTLTILVSNNSGIYGTKLAPNLCWDYGCVSYNPDFTTIDLAAGAHDLPITFILHSDLIQFLIDHGWNTATYRQLRISSFMPDYPNIKVLGSSDPASYPLGQFFQCNSIFDSNIQDLTFAFNITGQTIASNISLDFPADNASTPDFSYWNISGAYNGSSTAVFGEVWSATTTTPLTNQTPTWKDQSIQNIPIGNFSLPVFNNRNFLVGTTYYALAIIRDVITDEILSTSDIIEFQINGAPPIYGIPTSTSTEMTITCDPDSPLWEQSLCYLATYLFVPSPSSLDSFNNLIYSIENKPPIGYFYAVKTALTGLNASGTPAFVLETASSTLNTPIFTPLKSGISFILWLFFGFWVFNRIRHFYI
jgi:hypothetical protein